MVDLDRFKFIFFVSFESEAESIALELLEAFDSFCKRFGYLSFELTVRLKQERRSTRLWDKDFIREEIEKLDISEIQRIWVCGPPAMNELFDKAFQELIEEGI